MNRLIVNVLTIILLMLPCVTHGDWEATLSANFDIVDTFDNITPWYGTTTGNVDNQTVMPNKTGGSDSIWQFYSADYVGTPEKPWIGDHGMGNNFSGSQSLCINYHLLYTDNPEEMRGYGPSRLATFFGDGITGNSGYETIHVFFMQKYAPGYFKIDPSDGDGYAMYTSGYNKLYDIASGFTAITHWGNTEEYNSVCMASSSAGRNDYGLNCIVINAFAGGASLPYSVIYGVGGVTHAYVDTTNCPEPTDTPLYYTNMSGSPFYFPTVNVATQHDSGVYYGVEIIAKISTMNASDGYVTIKTYTNIGTLIGEQIKTGLDSLRMFNHKYNKFVFGGNRAYTDPATNAITTESRIYYDDFIIDDQEIAPRYFTLLTGIPKHNSKTSNALHIRNSIYK